ncbi:glycosyl hydrolase 2 galactose-binding domain-containing protein [Demequina litorisediminis]|uniref:Beta-mannosidase-like galactose-binding domain-containing protein n=1 Tax=Demequina litorisediminis TaxID=1849022 RepID=A0ABQ6ILV0_9MICO|nr:hypothetical protein [Demequina litorisediminis]GMA37653.1 hypothetical protein GCM10025876_38570 [Demequina litorisediminis]
MTARQATRTPQTRWTLDLTHAAPSAPGSVIDALTGGIGVAVPGSVLGALIERGLATDVTVDGHEADVEWAAQSTWMYRTEVARTGAGADVTLVLEGVDTFGTVRVDGVEVLTTDDMFHAWRVPLGVDNAPGAWNVEIELAPAEAVARENQAVNPLPRADMYEIPYNQVRKMACSFGWDWGPTTITAGLFRAAVVERTPVARLSGVRLSALWEGGARLTGAVEIAGEASSVLVCVLDGDDEPDPGARRRDGGCRVHRRRRC